MSMYIRKPGLILFLLLLLTAGLHAQQNKTGVKTVLTADSLASGNLKDLLTSFFQLSFTNLTGKNRELNFSSNPYAVILRTNPAAASDQQYRKYRIHRKFNFGFGLKLDEDYRFNGFSSGIKYALINKRDSTVSGFLFAELGKDSLNRELDQLAEPVAELIQELDKTEEEKDKLLDELNEVLTNQSLAFSGIDSSLQRLIRQTAVKKKFIYLSRLLKNKPQVILAKEAQQPFKELKKELQQKLLWTVSVSDTTYTDQFMFSNLVFRSDILKGMGRSKPGANWEFSLPVALNLQDDSLRAGRDLRRSEFSFEPGINLVIRDRDNEQSFLEFKLSGGYYHRFAGLYPGEKKDRIRFDGTLRVRLIGDIWIPLVFSYDPKNGNVFGFISARLNFSGQSKK